MVLRMRLVRGGHDGERGTDRRSGTGACVFVVGAGVLVAVCTGLVSGLVPAPGVGVAGVVVVVVVAVALVWLAFGQRPVGLLRAVSAGALGAILTMSRSG